MELESVLIIDDDPDILALAELCLSHAGITVYRAEGGEPALATLESARPQMVVIDVMMPGLDGPATVARMRRQFPDYHPCLVFLTGKVQEQTRSELLDLGADAVMRKPFSPVMMVDQLREIYADRP